MISRDFKKLRNSSGFIVSACRDEAEPLSASLVLGAVVSHSCHAGNTVCLDEFTFISSLTLSSLPSCCKYCKSVRFLLISVWLWKEHLRVSGSTNEKPLCNLLFHKNRNNNSSAMEELHMQLCCSCRRENQGLRYFLVLSSRNRNSITTNASALQWENWCRWWCLL